MKFLFNKIYVKSIRRIIKLPPVKTVLIKYVPHFQSISESIYVRYKDSESNLLDILCNKNKISLDIGSLWGGYTILLRSHSSQVHSFEPNISNYNFLVRSFKNDVNVKIHNLAVSDVEDTLTLRVPEDSPGNATIAEENKLENFENVSEYSVRTITLDNVDPRNVGFIKIDIEGHEYSALKGMQRILKMQRPNLLVEIEERHNKGALYRVLSFMKNLDYGAFYLVEGNLCDADNFAVSSLQIPKNRNTNKYINNFIFIPAERKDSFLSNIESRGIKPIVFEKI